MSSSTNKKRQYKGGGNNANNNKYHNNPKRGGPGVLLTAETGREKKCKFEALDILQHYMSISNKNKMNNNKEEEEEEDDTSSTPTPTPNKEEEKLSLEDEIKMLQSQNNNNNNNKGGGSKKNNDTGFAVFDTGCRGTLFLLCTLPDCELIPPIKNNNKNKDDKAGRGKEEDNTPTNEKEDGNDEEPSKEEEEVVEDGPPDTKRARVAEVVVAEGKDDDNDETTNTTNTDTTPSTSSSPVSAVFDPIHTVRSVLVDLELGSRTMPSSRFITRMIPIQATCFASIPEIELTVEALLQKYFIPIQPKTFAISAKRRMCTNVTRNQIIDCIASLVIKTTSPNGGGTSPPTVDLDNPDVTIVVEICKTLAGISIVPKCKQEFHNFNLAMVKERKMEKDASIADADDAQVTTTTTTTTSD